MSWRNFENHKDETKAVKKALSEAGINALVGHGSGTAWAWLEINVGERQGEHEKPDGGYNYSDCFGNCPICGKQHELVDNALKIAMQVTGRHGDHHGQILILTQDHWDKKQNKRVAILQDYEKKGGENQ